jgi:hypothetical protein
MPSRLVFLKQLSYSKVVKFTFEKNAGTGNEVQKIKQK